MTFIAKRGCDIIIATIAVILLSPLLVLVALLIRLDSPGPVLFTQQRIGMGLRTFRILKFRTMLDRDPASIDQIAEGVIATGSDPRITRVGRILRAASLDELPQLFNILKGDMSLVGPRPILQEQVEVIPQEYMKRFSVRPGLTGLAQVRGRRSLGWLEQLYFDTEYVDRSSFIFDLWLMLLTIYVVLTCKGVYGGTGKNWREYREDPRSQNVGKSK